MRYLVAAVAVVCATWFGVWCALKAERMVGPGVFLVAALASTASVALAYGALKLMGAA